MLDKKKKKDLEIFAAEIRMQTFRELSVLGFGHVGGSMSIADVLAVLYGIEMKVDPKKPQDLNRDFLALSKGHAGPALYATLALKGFFPIEWLDTLNQNGTRLPSHCSRIHTPGIDLTTGALGQGISSAIGTAVASRVLKGNNYSYCIVGDGECDEGQIWEGVLFAAHQKLDNFILFVDYNKVQLDGPVENICNLADLSKKFESFNWDVQEVNGHDVGALYDAIETAKSRKGKPSVIIMDTIKGKGCALAESTTPNHHMMFPDKEVNLKEMSRLQGVVEQLKSERSALG